MTQRQYLDIRNAEGALHVSFARCLSENIGLDIYRKELRLRLLAKLRKFGWDKPRLDGACIILDDSEKVGRGLTGEEIAELDRSIDAIPRKALARHIAYMPQGHVVYWALEVYQVVALGRLPHLNPFTSLSPADAEAVESALVKADVLEFAERDITTLSDGERARVMLARALAVESPVLLVDEPIASLDPFHQIKVMHLLRAVAEEGRLVIAVLHDLPLAARFCDRLLLLGEGRLVADGSPADVLNDQHLADTYAIEGLRGSRAGEEYVLPWRCLDREVVHPNEGGQVHAHLEG